MSNRSQTDQNKVAFICESNDILNQRADKKKPKRCNFCGSSKIRVVMVQDGDV